MVKVKEVGAIDSFSETMRFDRGAYFSRGSKFAAAPSAARPPRRAGSQALHCPPRRSTKRANILAQGATLAAEWTSVMSKDLMKKAKKEIADLQVSDGGSASKEYGVALIKGALGSIPFVAAGVICLPVGGDCRQAVFTGTVGSAVASL